MHETFNIFNCLSLVFSQMLRYTSLPMAAELCVFILGAEYDFVVFYTLRQNPWEYVLFSQHLCTAQHLFN